MDEFATEAQRTRTEIARELRDLADQLEVGEQLQFDVGTTSVQLTPTDPITYKLAGEVDWTAGDTDANQRIEIELVWRRAAQTAK